MLGRWTLLLVLMHVAGFSGTATALGLYGGNPISSIGRDEAGTDILPQPASAVLGAVAAQAWEENPTVFGIRALDRWRRNYGTDAAKMLTAEEANQKYNLPGMTPFTANTTDDVAGATYESHRMRLERDNTVARRQGFGTGMLPRFAVSILVSFLDPIYFIPTIVVARSKAGRRVGSACGRGLANIRYGVMTMWHGLVFVG